MRYEHRFTKFPVWPWNLTFDLESRTTITISIKFLNVVLPSYQIWSWSVKQFRNYLKLKFSQVKVLSARHRTPEARCQAPDIRLRTSICKKNRLGLKQVKNKNFLVSQKDFFFDRNGRKHSHKMFLWHKNCCCNACIFILISTK